MRITRNETLDNVNGSMGTYAFNKLRETLFVAESTRKSMQGNRATGTQPEEMFRQALWRAGVRGYRKNVKSLPGKPDVVIPRYRLAIFVHGCYWHQCPICNRNRAPKTNSAYWKAKFESNVERDRRNTEELTTLGYTVRVVWECQVRADPDLVVRSVMAETGKPNLNKTGG
jgi:DNA mismatch endonuclease (patch repair protein)